MTTDLLLGYLEGLKQEYGQIQGGEVATYIPELAKADPDWFGITVVTVDGHVYQVGDTLQNFTIQSISKVITYGIGLECNGVEPVLKKIDVEPSGEAFNQISLEPNTGRPRNPMINAGAISAMAFVEGDSMDQKLKRILDTYERYIGHPVSVDQEVYQSEKSTGHRNRAIAYMLRNYDIIENNTDELLDLYFKQCSILVNCRDLALMAATLANTGVNPITGVRAIKRDYVPKLLSVMSSCGMYDFSGAWVYEVGMPAKSGVAGGIMAVLPGQLGIGVFSPKLDDRGNSVRGISVCKRISNDFGLHMFHSGRTTATSVLHSTYDVSSVTSKRSRPNSHQELLREQGKRIVIQELQGDLMFASGEIVVSAVMYAIEDAEYVILDFRRVAAINEGAMILLSHLIKHVYSSGKTLLFTNLRDRYAFAQVLKTRIPNIKELSLFDFDELDEALEWSENQVLKELQATVPAEVGLGDQDFCTGLSTEELARLEQLVDKVSYSKGSYICRVGEPAAELYFIVSGQVDVMVPIDPRRDSRITTLSAGASFGEMGLLDHGVRSANVVANSELTCFKLSYDQLENDRSEIGISIQLKLISNIGRTLTNKLRHATLEIQSLKS